MLFKGVKHVCYLGYRIAFPKTSCASGDLQETQRGQNADDHNDNDQPDDREVDVAAGVGLRTEWESCAHSCTMTD